MTAMRTRHLASAWLISVGLLVAPTLVRAQEEAADDAEAAASDSSPPAAPAPAAATPTPDAPGSLFDDLPEEQPRQEPIRNKDASWRDIFSGPFRSSRLYAMPVADVVGAYQLSISGDGSLLQETGVLSSAGVLAIGFGDIAQLEYRHTGVIGVGNGVAPIPSLGVQLRAPFAERRYVPAFAVAFRLGVARTEDFAGVDVDETVTDLYFVSRLKLWGALERFTLHGALRISSASMEFSDETIERRLYLPAGGWDVQLNDRTRFVGEAALVPLFRIDEDPAGTRTGRIKTGVLGRLGIRWYLHPAFTIDASVGYQLEVAKLSGGMSSDPSAVVDWDIRLGGEIFIPWGAIACHGAGIFCE